MGHVIHTIRTVILLWYRHIMPYRHAYRHMIDTPSWTSNQSWTIYRPFFSRPIHRPNNISAVCTATWKRPAPIFRFCNARQYKQFSSNVYAAVPSLRHGTICCHTGNFVQWVPSIHFQWELLCIETLSGISSSDQNYISVPNDIVIANIAE